jgi:ribosomal protein S18 acetylase RimI-like enzyme
VELTLRPAEPRDRPFLVDLYASTRLDELGASGWTQPEWDAFIDMQFTAQDAAYRGKNPDASFDVVLLDGGPVGRLYVDRRSDAIHIIDVVIAPPWRNLGIGSAALRDLMDEAAHTHRVVSLYVESINPARQWYERLGFRARDEQGIHLLMVWGAG